MSSAELIREAVAATSHLADGVSPDNRSGRTPCAEFNVGDLLAHVAGFMATSIAAALRSYPADDADLGDNPRATWHVLGSTMADAWATPDAFEGRTHLGAREMSAFIAGHITLFETLVHGWDLATATGQRLELSNELSETSLVTAQRLCVDRAREAGAFGREVNAPAGGGPFEQASALAGRDPNWSA